MNAPTKPAPRAPGPCDICREPIAPFGYAPPGLRSLKPGQRALRSCASLVCRAAAEARRDAALNPFQRAKTASADVVALPVPARLRSKDRVVVSDDEPQGRLF